jgi:hypothetical protein
MEGGDNEHLSGVRFLVFHSLVDLEFVYLTLVLTDGSYLIHCPFNRYIQEFATSMVIFAVCDLQ